MLTQWVERTNDIESSSECSNGSTGKAPTPELDAVHLQLLQALQSSNIAIANG